MVRSTAMAAAINCTIVLGLSLLTNEGVAAGANVDIGAPSSAIGLGEFDGESIQGCPAGGMGIGSGSETCATNDTHHHLPTRPKIPTRSSKADIPTSSKVDVLAQEVEQDDDEEVRLGQQLVNWVRSSPRGYVHPNVEIRRENPKDPTSMVGVFAKGPINADDMLASIPWNMMVKPADDVFESFGEEGVLANDDAWCEGIYAMIHEMRPAAADGGYSFDDVSPYADYLLTQAANTLPAAWSRRGRDLLVEIMGDHLPPFDMDEDVKFYRDKCMSDDPNLNDAFAEHVAMLVQARAEDLLMVPFYDMHNHRNGKWLNTRIEYRNKVGVPFEMYASRAIETGEQIYGSYNMCNRCAGRADRGDYGTPQILRDYGFVEQMPQRWTLGEMTNNGIDEPIKFDLDDEGEGEPLSLTWWGGKPPTYRGYHHLRGELERLNKFAQTKRDRLRVEESLGNEDHGMSRFEWDIAWAYHDALTVAIRRAIGATEESEENYLTELRAMTGAEVREELISRGVDVEDEEDYAYDDEDYEEELVQRLLLARMNREGEYDGANSDDDGDFQPTCSEFLDQEGYVDVFDHKSMYQHSFFDENPGRDDRCMTLDSIVQICTSYRPHYHEPFVHFPASYLPGPLRRVVFLGGGDSMLLHEILKYPTIELVLGLELDQSVVRNSFKHFRTQPHFDDDRVRWWFGDAAKSLLLLPREYFGSFDLVLVDLSETVMSISVTDDMDIFDVLKLMLRPDTGIFVKNEVHVDMHHMSSLFKHAVELYMPDVPMICHQDWVMGSNGIDFLSPANFDMLRETHEGGDRIETLIYEPLDDVYSHYGLIEKYAKNTTSSSSRAMCQGRQDEGVEAVVAEETISSAAAAGAASPDPPKTATAGLLLVVEAEGAETPLGPDGDDLEAALLHALNNSGCGGLTDLSAVNLSPPESSIDADIPSSSVVVSTQEGFVAAHAWPSRNYVALDVHLWGAFGRQECIRDALLGVLGVDMSGGGNDGGDGQSRRQSWSSYRVVVGGMSGVSGNTHVEDEGDRIGPPPRATESTASPTGHGCDEKDDNRPSIEDETQVLESMAIDRKKSPTQLDSIVREGMLLIEDEAVVAVVLCGRRNSKKKCHGIDALKKSDNVEEVIAVWACSAHQSTKKKKEDQKEGDGVRHVSLCDGWEAVSSAFQKNDGIHAVLVDPSAPVEVVEEAADTICAVQESPDRHMIFVVPNIVRDSFDAAKRKFFSVCLDRLHVQPLETVDINLGGGDGGSSIQNVGIISSGNEEFLPRLADLTGNMERSTGIQPTIRRMRGFKKQFQEDYDAIHFAPHDYDQLPALEQFASQQPLGHQSLFGFELIQNSAEDEDGISTETLEDALEYAVSSLLVSEYDDSTLQARSLDVRHYDAGGDKGGALLISLWSKGHAIVAWDGSTHIHLNIFTCYGHDNENDINHRIRIVDRFLEELPTHAKLVQHDEQPRGVGRVVNFRGDVDASPGCWDLSATCHAIADTCTWEENPGWIETHCRRTCGLC